MSRHPIVMDIESRESELCDYPKVMHDIYAALKEALGDCSNRSTIALEQLERICSMFGGIQIYVSSDATTFRNVKICAHFNGRNVAELARQYRISTQSVYSILKKSRYKLPKLGVLLSGSANDVDIFEQNRSFFHSTTVEIYDVLTGITDPHGLDRQVAYSQLMNIIEKYGGKQIYVPTGRLLQSRMKKFEIWDDYNGSNIKELSDKYGISMNHVWRVIADMRKTIGLST